jgi:type II secretory pathway predicted ATPase ExeA
LAKKMYLEHFGLSQKPFSLVTSANGCILIPSLKRELNRCIAAIDESRCPVLIAGPSGCGKTTLLALLENHFSRELRTVRLDCSLLSSREELVQSLLFAIGLPFASRSMGELRLSMIDFLKSAEHCPHGILLLVDEAQLLSDQGLEELRLMTNLVCAGRSQVKIVLAGSLTLEENLSRQEALSQRIAVRSYPGPMSYNETALFVLAQMQLAGRDGREVFQPSALEKIQNYTGGVARVICQLTDNALRTAFERKCQKIDAAIVEAAWYDLQQLPAPSPVDSKSRAVAGPSAAVIEFGSLSDGPAGTPLGRDAAADSVAAEKQPPQDRERADTDDGPWYDIERELADKPENSKPRSEALNVAVVAGESADAGAETDGDRSESAGSVDERLEELLRKINEIDAAPAPVEADPPLAQNSGTADLTADGAGRQEVAASDGLASPNVDVDSVFGTEFHQEEEVVDIQSLRIASQNRSSARTSTRDLSEVTEAESPPAWAPVGNEIVFPMETMSRDHGGAARGHESTAAPKSAEKIAKDDEGRMRMNSGATMPGDEGRNDDRDIIVAGKGEASPPDETKTTTPPATAAPTGTVIRMDYKDLFRQLRSSSDVDQ